MLLKEINNNGKKLSLTYDAVGNIITISENGVQKVKYTYNALSELTRVDSAWENKSITYTYDCLLYTSMKDAFSYEPEVVVEEYIEGREFSVGVVDGKA